MSRTDARREGSGAPSVAFYCVADERYFLGAVALLNSARLVGHDDPMYVLDCGLSDWQRELVAAHATLVEPPREAPPWLLKTVAPLANPARVMVLLDTDMILTRSLAPLIERALGGRLVAFRNPIDRFVPEWGELLGLGPTRRGPYVCSGALCVDGALGAEVLLEVEDRQQAIDFERSYWRRDDPGYAFRFGDQDVLNAVISTRIEPERLVALDARLAATPPFAGLELIDPSTLRCRYEDGAEPYLLHQYLPSKPWLAPAHHGVYSRLLRRLLIGADVAIGLPEDHVPRWLRGGALAYAERTLVNARERLRWHVGEPMAARAKGVRRAAGR